VCKILVTSLAAAIGFAGWINLADAGLLSATRSVIAVLGADLYVGVAEGHLSGAGTLVIRSQIDPNVTCFGEFTSSALLGGAGQLRCSDGATATFHFQRLSVFSGYGVGSLRQGAMSFTYGLTADEARPYLKLPPGKTLTHDGKELQLVSL
jgi:hypothetical protein